MKANHAVRITYQPFNKPGSCTFVIEPYCVKVFENRWYVIARNPALDDMRTYCFDRIEKVEPTDEVFKLPAAFSASEFFSSAYGIVIDGSVAPEPIVIRADKCHTPYLKSLPLHHSQRLLEETDEYADFGLYLAPTYDFVMKLLQAGSKIEVMAPPSLRETMREWISAMYRLYENG